MRRRRLGARKVARAAAALGCGFFLGTFAPISHVAPAPPPPPGTVRVTAESVPLDRSDPARRTLGRLTWLAGYRLRSDDVRFGGLSAMHVEAGEVLAVSDAGTVFRFPLPAGPGDLPLVIERLPSGPGSGRRKTDRDAESLVVRGAQAWIAFEGRNAVWRYALPAWGFEAASAPAAMSAWPSNAGSEAMARLRDGSFLLFAEGPVEDGTSPILLFDGDPALASTNVTEMRYRPPPGYRVTDAAALPDGRIVFLNRTVAMLGWRAVLTIADRPDPSAAAVLEGRELAALGGSVTADNMEALSVTREGGQTILWIASDDNVNPLLQQTLLLKFALD